jgi:putative transposase
MNIQEFSQTNNCVFSLTYHMVLVVKRRRPALTGPMIDRIRLIAQARCEARGGHLVELGGEVDHVHLLFQLPPTEGLADFANALKTNSSRLLRRDYPQLKRLGSALWSPSYFVCTCGGGSLEAVKEYVRSQERPD